MRSLTRTLILMLALLAVSTVAQPNRVHAAVYVELALQATLASATGPIEALVNYDPLVTSGPALAEAAQDLGAGTITFQHLDTLAVRATAAQLDQIAALPGVTGLYTNAPLQYHAQPTVLQYVGVDRVWEELGYTGEGIGIAIVDSGIDTNHPDLAYGSKTVQNVLVVADPNQVYHFKARPGRPLYLEDQIDTDPLGHGSAVAGVAAGSGAASGGYYAGVAKGAHLIGISLGLVPDLTFTLSGMAAFDYVLEHARAYNIKAVNIAFGKLNQGSAYYDPYDPVNQATRKLHRRGITVAISGGNNGPHKDTLNVYSMVPWVIAVAAGCVPPNTDHCYLDPDPDESGNGLLAGFSSRGVPGHAQFHPTLTAPGASIVVPIVPSAFVPIFLTEPNDIPCNQQIHERSTADAAYYACGYGTSFAAPHVAGTVALMQQAAGGRLRPDQIKNILVRTARPMYKADGTPYEEWEVGAGYLDVYAAVQEAARR